MTKIPSQNRNSKNFTGKSSPGRRVPHNATLTQIQSWDQTQAEKIPATQEQTIIQFLSANGPATSRMIAAATRLERTAVCRQIAGMKQTGRVVVFKEAPCPVTSRIVEYYAVPRIAKQATLFPSPFARTM